MKIKRLSKFQLNRQGMALTAHVCEFQGKIVYLATDGQSSLVHTLTPMDNGYLQLNVAPAVWNDSIGWLKGNQIYSNVSVCNGVDGWKLYTIKQGLFNLF